MKILQVSAHYPPDFVSGGALIPQRFAQELTRRGYDCAVFAGKLKDLEPGDVLDEQSGQVRLRWVGNSDALAWSDRRNFDNEVMYGPFADFLAEFRPDLVHFHSIQTIGGATLKLAKESGAIVVLTMHDFWWTCARQFLVDRGGRPCSPVVSAATCQCEAGRELLDERNAWLSEQLMYADLVLFPSESARALMVANGVPAEKTAVNENGVDVGESQGPHVVTDRPVRFMYTGAEAEMKGYRILKEACAGADVPPGTTLDLYNTDSSGFPAWAHSQPAYGREDLPRIFGEHDVLILPSVMRESHSLVTREALAAGMAVIATDSFGPEEAVKDGFNGYLVASGSSADLRGAIEKLARPETTRELLNRGSASPIVSVAEQIDDLEGHYAQLVSLRRATKAPLTAADAMTEADSADVVRRAVAKLIRQVVIAIGIGGASARYRAHLPAEGLALRGINARVMHYRDPELPAAALAADAVVFYRVPATHQVLELIEQIKALPRIVPVVGDVDDLIFDPEIFDSLDNLDGLSDDARALWMRGIHRYRTTFDACDYFIGSTPTVSREAERLLGVPAQTYSNGVGQLLGEVSDREACRQRKPGPLRIGFFSGTDTHDADWASIEPAIAAVMAGHPDVELWLGGLVEPTSELAAFQSRIVRIPFVAWHELPAYLRDIDVCLAPLTTGSIFNEAKSAIKWLEAALVETPTVAFPTGPFRQSITDGVTGFLASDNETWRRAIEALLDDDALRRRVGRLAKRSALLALSPSVQGRAYENILIDAWLHVERNGHKVSGDFPPVVDDEPTDAMAALIERYAIPQAGQARIDGVRMTALKTIHSLRVNGVSGTARKVVDKIRGKR